MSSQSYKYSLKRSIFGKQAIKSTFASHAMPLEELKDRSNGKYIVGSAESFWIWSPETGWDLTHPTDPDSDPIPGSFHLDCEVSDVVLDSVKTALVIVDMQNISLSSSLHGEVNQAMQRAEANLLKYAIPAARSLELRIVWLNWGFTQEDVESLSPAEIRVFGFKANSDKADYGMSDRVGDPTDPDNFIRCGEYAVRAKIPGVDLGEVILEDGSRVPGGRVMMRDTWNADLHPPLAEAYEEGKKAQRKDVWMNKDRNSGLWRKETQFSEFLHANGIRTLIFAGANTDQCVGATLYDAHARGFDTIMLRDGCATDSPDYAQQSFEYNNVRNWGFLTSCKALAKAAGLEW